MGDTVKRNQAKKLKKGIWKNPTLETGKKGKIPMLLLRQLGRGELDLPPVGHGRIKIKSKGGFKKNRKRNAPSRALTSPGTVFPHPGEPVGSNGRGGGKGKIKKVRGQRLPFGGGQCFFFVRWGG